MKIIADGKTVYLFADPSLDQRLCYFKEVKSTLCDTERYDALTHVFQGESPRERYSAVCTLHIPTDLTDYVLLINGKEFDPSILTYEIIEILSTSDRFGGFYKKEETEELVWNISALSQLHYIKNLIIARQYKSYEISGEINIKGVK